MSKRPRAEYKQSGILAREANSSNGVVLEYAEPQEARKPGVGYRLYVFKGDEQIDMLHVSRQSCYLFGRERRVCDIPIDHPSCSKQHAVLQYRLSAKSDTVKPYMIDLESANGTFVNKKRIPASRYYELYSGDVVTFGFSTREYVFMLEEEEDLAKDKKHKKDDASDVSDASD